MNGLFIVFEGADGTGKTTQAKRLTSLLNTLHPTVYTREPGGTAFGNRLREAILHTDEVIDPLAEILAHFSARRQHLTDFIIPQREAKNWVICDRFIDSSYLYQVMTQGVPDYIYHTLVDWVVEPHQQPDLTIVLDVSDAVREERLAVRQEEQNRHDALDPAKLNLMGAYLREQVKEHPQRYLLVDGDGDEVTVFERVLQALSTRIALPFDVTS